MAFISIKADSRAVEKRLNKIATGIKDYKKPLKESSEFSMKTFTENFKVGGAKFEKWKRLSPATIIAKARLGFPADPLIATGRMMKSFKILKLERFVAIVNNPVKYFKYHQLGGGRIPKRVMIAINREMTKKIVDIFNKYIKALMR